MIKTKKNIILYSESYWSPLFKTHTAFPVKYNFTDINYILVVAYFMIFY